MTYAGTWSNGGDHGGAMTFLSGYGGQMAGADQGRVIFCPKNGIVSLNTFLPY
jgi:hypothetical protein